MKEILKNHIEEMNKGLFLLDAPTGYGKTTAVIDYIVDYLKDENTDIKRIFFITNLKKNLPWDMLQDKISEKDFEEKCLVLLPYWEHIIKKFDDNKITNPIVRKSEQYLSLKVDIDSINKLKDDINDEKNINQVAKLTSKKILHSLEKKVERDSEPRFREFIKKEFFNNKASYEKQKVLKDNSWIEELYPICRLEKYKVVFCTINKFFLPFDPFYKMPFHIYNDELIKKSLIFIDEFDEAKKTLLDTIISDGIKLKIDIVKLFLNIHYALQNINIPKALEKLSEADSKRLEKYNKMKAQREIIEANKIKFKEIIDKYELNYLLKTKNSKNDKSFLFCDGNYVTITRDSSIKKLISYIDEDEEQRLIEAVAKKEKISLNDLSKNPGRKIKKNQIEVSDLIKEIIAAINHFITGATWISKYYMNYQISIKEPSSNYYTIEEATRSVLSVFNIGEEYYDYLVEMIMVENTEAKLYYYENDYKGYFMKHGLSLLEVEDSDYHNMQSVIHLFKFNITPEELLLRLSHESRIIGISATATLDTVLGNFDLEYLRKHLKDNFYSISVEESKRLEEDFNRKQSFYQEKEIMVDVNVLGDYATLDDKEKCVKVIDCIFKSIESRNKYVRYLESLDNTYYYLIVLMLAQSYYYFIRDESLKSFISFLNSFPVKKHSDKTFDKLYQEDIEEVLNDISKECKIHYLNGDNFDDELEIIHAELYNNQRCFVITTYQTVGTGKNIQYCYPKDKSSNLVITENKGYKDFDGIFLLKPTNLVQFLSYDSEQKMYDLSKFIFQQEYLYKKKYLYYYQMMDNIINAFRKLYFGNMYAQIRTKNNDLFINTAKIVIQAVGRICRTKNKNKRILITVDYEIVERIQQVKEALDERLLNYEFKKLLGVKIEEKEKLIEPYQSLNSQARFEINGKAWNVKRNKQNNIEWQELRDYVLKNPTCDEPIDKYKAYYFNFNLPTNKYSCIIRQYKLVAINPYSNYLPEGVSEIDSDLSLLMKIDIIKNYFLKNGYAIHFDKKKYIMSHALYKQVYLGALGEVVGKAILEDKFGIELQPIDKPEFYEYFDYQYTDYANNTDVYIDFKHWNNFRRKNDPYVEKFMDKLKMMNGKKCLIINIIQRDIGKSSIENIARNVIQIPWLISGEDIDDKQIKSIEEILYGYTLQNQLKM